MVPYSERRHRLNPVEIDPVKGACHDKILQLLSIQDPEDLIETIALFRVWYRIETHCTNKPAYPPHDSFNQIASYLNYGTEMGSGLCPSPQCFEIYKNLDSIYTEDRNIEEEA